MLEILRKMAMRIALFPVRPSKVLAAWGCRGLRSSVLFAHSTASSKPLVPIADGDLKMYRSRLHGRARPQLTLKPLFDSA